MKKIAVAATIAAMLALAGGAYAGGRWVVSNINQIKPSVRAHLKGNRGPTGPTGPQGSPGLNGQNGVVPQIVTVESPHITIQPGQTSADVAGFNWSANCPNGMVVLGTGFDGPFNVVGGFVKAYGTFVGGFFENDSSIPLSDVHLQAICGQVPAGSVRAARDVGAGEARYTADLRQAEAR